MAVKTLSARAVPEPAEAAAIDERGLRGMRGPRLRGRVAILSTWHPEPVDNGRKQRTRRMIEALSGDYDIVLISLLSDAELRRQPLPAVPGVWRQHAFPLPEFRPGALSASVAALSPRPRSLVATWSKDTALAIENAVAEAGASVVIGATLLTVRYLCFLRERNGSIRTILDEPDVSLFDTATSDGRVARARHTLRRRKYQRFLHSVDGGLDAVVAASPLEADAYARLSGSGGALVIGNGVSVFPAPWRPAASRQLLYTGSLTYGPNDDAVRYFADAILPRIAGSMDGVSLAVTGALPEGLEPGPLVPAVRLTGRLDDLEPVYRESRVFVAPIRAGTGTRVKLLEAMAIGMPVVTTSKGAEGLALTPGEHAFIADDPADFARATLLLLHDDRLAQSLGARGRDFVTRHGNWKTSAAQLRQLVDRLTDGKP